MVIARLHDLVLNHFLHQHDGLLTACDLSDMGFHEPFHSVLAEEAVRANHLLLIEAVANLDALAKLIRDVLQELLVGHRVPSWSVARVT